MSIAVIVPVLDDAEPLESCLTDLAQATKPLEVHVVDGGQCQRSQELAAAHGVNYHRSAPGRGPQQNLAAAAAVSPWLWFLHADTRLPREAIDALQAHCATAAPGWGCFRQHIAHPHWSMRIIEAGANLRARLGLPYGDQGIFAHRDCFRTAGGFPNEPFLEDLALAKSLRKQGRPSILSPTITSDGRRWQQLGIARTTWRNWRILAMHLSGSRNTARMSTIYTGPKT
ncbi:MAG: rSAM/selenodomain-associated transferase 2 [Planctomycetota bacterium]